MIHVLVHMGLLGGRETSETIAKMLNTNPVVVRRMMAALKASGVVSSEGGRGGGWILLRPLAEISVLDVQQALDQRPVLTPGISNDHPTCPVEGATNSALTAAFDNAESVIRNEFSRLTLAEIARTALTAANAGPASAAK